MRILLLLTLLFILIGNSFSQEIASPDSINSINDSTFASSDSVELVNSFTDFIDTTSGLNIEMIAIKGDSFMMGSNFEVEEQPIHQVILDDYYIGRFEFTQRQWKIVMGHNPSRYKGDSLPVEQISWNTVQRFLVKLNELTGKDYRLPTEAEWEYATKAGTNTPFNVGECLSSDEANYNGNFPYLKCDKGVYRKKTLPIGTFAPNAWGLYDTHGNVWEWCHDIYSDDYYKISPGKNPQGAAKGTYRSIRGGGWGYFADGCRTANRGFYGGSISYDGIGFRLACTRTESE